MSYYTIHNTFIPNTYINLQLCGHRTRIADHEDREKLYLSGCVFALIHTDSLVDKWVVIDKNVPHEFFPEEENMGVVSFHTCEATELSEVGCETGEKRLYDGKSELFD
jgi:hypothetical protein